MPDGAVMLVVGDLNTCFAVVADLGLRPAAPQSGGACLKRQILLRAAIEFIHRQHGSGRPWVCYLGPAGAFDSRTTTASRR